jgi:2-methylcitrate dehydratase PrpD
VSTVTVQTDHVRLFEQAAMLSWGDVPPELRAHASRVFADTIGVILAGGRQPEVVALAADRGRFFGVGSGASTMLVDGLPRTSAAGAAFVNGTAGTFLELDEACPPASHPAIHVLPAAFAVAEALGSTGRDLMRAFVAGYEVVARLFDAYQLPYPIHPHGHLGAVGAAVAVAMLRGVAPAEPASIAASLPILATWDACLEGATVRNTWAGAAAETGVRANALAKAGFTGSRTAMATAFGGLVGALGDPGALVHEVDPERLRIGQNYFKFHSACAGAHPALDATLAFGPIPAEQVEDVLVEVAPQNWKLNAQSRGNELSNRFSIPYAVAAAIVHGHTGPAAFATDPQVQRLASRVTVRAAPDLDAPYPPTRMPARVSVSVGGRVSTRAVEHPYGHVTNPASPERLRAKFESIVPAEMVGRYGDLIGIEDITDVRELFLTASVPS